MIPSHHSDVDEYGYCPQHGIPVRPNQGCSGCVTGLPSINPARRLNVGCGEWPLLYYTNLDADPKANADLYVKVPPLPFDDGGLDDIYAGHFLEHLTPEDADEFLRECFRCLVPGGRLGIVVPDTRIVMERWLGGDPGSIEYPAGTFRPRADLDTICELFLYSTVQESPHRWSYDSTTLARRITRAGFTLTQEIHRYTDIRIPVGAWYQCGWDAVKP